MLFANVEFTRDVIDGFVDGVHILYLYSLWAFTTLACSIVPI